MTLEEKQAAASTVQVGQCVDFVDPLGNPHEALVTAVWGERKVLDNGEWTPQPAINLLFVTDDKSKKDQYGHQIERYTSVVHVSQQSAHGMFWREVE